MACTCGRAGEEGRALQSRVFNAPPRVDRTASQRSVPTGCSLQEGEWPACKRKIWFEMPTWSGLQRFLKIQATLEAQREKPLAREEAPGSERVTRAVRSAEVS